MRASWIAALVLAACNAPTLTADVVSSFLPSEEARPSRPPLQLTMGKVTAGASFTAIATHAEPGDKVIFLMSAGEVAPGPCPEALGGTCLDLARPYVIGRVVADEKGAAVLEAVLPPQTETGSSISFEAVVSRGEDGADTEKSNPVQVVITR